MTSDYRKLCIRRLDEEEKDDQIRAACEKQGHVVNFNRPAHNRSLAFAQYLNETDAKLALHGLRDAGYSADYARIKGDKIVGKPMIERKLAEEFRTTANGNNEVDHATSDSTDNLTDSEDALCSFCNEDAAFTCDRCGDFYCSEKCQKADWKRHRTICFPMPKLKRSSQSMTSIKRSLESERAGQRLLMNKNFAISVDALDGSIVKSPRVPKSGSLSPIMDVPKRTVSTVKPKTLVETTTAPNESDVSTVGQTPPKQVEVPSIKKESKVEPAVTRNESDVSIVTVVPVKQEERTTPAAAEKVVEPKATAPVSNDYVPKNGDQVFITHVNNYSSVFVRPVELEVEYMSLIQEVASSAPEAPQLKQIPARNDLVAALFDGEYYRAMVIGVDEENEKAKVAFIDFGNTSNVPLVGLKELPSEFKDVRRYIKKVVLKNVARNADNADDLEKYLTEFATNQEPFVVKFDEGDTGVELVHAQSKESVNKALQGMIKTLLTLSALPKKKLTAQNQELIIVCSANLKENKLVCLAQQDSTTFAENDSNLQEHGQTVDDAPPYTPQVGELVMAKFLEDEHTYVWYRCEVQHIEGNKAKVLQIDYGNIKTVSFNEVRALNNDSLFEVQSLYCRFADFAEMLKTSKPIELKQKYADYTTFKAKSIQPDGNDEHVITV